MNLVKESIAVLDDAKHYLENLSSEAYSQSIPLLSHSSIGQHTRHYIEFYQCLISQVDGGTINYCLRKRDISLEQDPLKALQAIDIIKTNLVLLDELAELTVVTAKEKGVKVKSSFKRELYYNIEHCIHHFALIKIGLKVLQPSMQLDPNFGFAPSTVQHKNCVIQS